MTPDRALHRDSREDIEGLVHRGRIILPDVIRPDGTASPDQMAIVPPGVDLAKRRCRIASCRGRRAPGRARRWSAPASPTTVPIFPAPAPW